MLKTRLREYMSETSHLKSLSAGFNQNIFTHLLYPLYTKLTNHKRLFLVCFSFYFSLRYKYCQLLQHTDWNFGNLYCSWYLCCALSPKIKEPKNVPSQPISCSYFMHSFSILFLYFFQQFSLCFLKPLSNLIFRFILLFSVSWLVIFFVFFQNHFFLLGLKLLTRLLSYKGPRIPGKQGERNSINAISGAHRYLYLIEKTLIMLDSWSIVDEITIKTEYRRKSLMFLFWNVMDR